MLLVGASRPGLASERIDHLYEALVPIDSASAEVQQLALQQGLADVLQKISGYSGTPEFAGLAPAISRAPSLVSEYGIRQGLRAAEDGIGVVDTAVLYMRFAPAQIDPLLRQFEIPQWPASRPKMLVLVLTELAGRPYLLGRERWPGLYAELEHWSYRRGIPLDLLSQDELASLGLSARAVASLDQLALQVLMELKGVDRVAIVQVGEASQTGGWRLNLLGSVGFEPELSTPESGLGDLAGLFDTYLDQLSLDNAFVAVAESSRSAVVRVAGVSSFEDYRRVRAFLDQVDQVDGYRLVRVDEQEMLISVQFQSGISQLQQSLRQADFLVPEEVLQSDLGEQSSAALPLSLAAMTRLAYRFKSISP